MSASSSSCEWKYGTVKNTTFMELDLKQLLGGCSKRWEKKIKKSNLSIQLN